ncbi:LPS-assembly protein LptD [Agaricicola taiwanensis]|uniref:LPS-assembly protein LptD n=1 Tax=Agaricicola taiwanensis TaxID=591372 RepID=A0A8J3DWI8_9RHOB|nr:LPS-assembly protein LptD [Agaricicola taiwanensis]GGE46848.1 LPS-assembly protein LptD [Agaricicola taiwanensis]
MSLRGRLRRPSPITSWNMLQARRGAPLLAALMLGCSVFAVDAAAQAQQPPANDLASSLTAGRNDDPNARMLVEAAEVLYDYDKETVSAIGDAVIYYDGSVLQADRVIYDQKNGRLRATGNVRLLERDGNVIHSESLDMSDDFAQGFVQSLQVETAARTNFAATSAQRKDGRITVFENGVYSACATCKDNPDRPPLWRVRAARIISDQQEKMVYYEDARLEFFGVPIAYLPFFQHPDPTVKRKSGLLVPTYIASSELGFGVRVPYFWNIAPNKDLTITPTVMSRQGLMLEGEWRHRLLNGAYTIRAAGVFQADSDAFPASPFGAADEDARGAFQTRGEFAINQHWEWGWNINLLSDKWVLDDYNLWGSGWNEAISTIYLTGLEDRSYFDLRGYYFLGLSSDDRQKELPVVFPLVDYNRVFDQPVLGGEMTFSANFTSLRRLEGDFEPTSPGNTLALNSTTNYTCNSFTVDCLAPGIAGNYTRASADLQWRKQIIDRIGQVWTPFAFVRGDMIWRDPSDTVGNASFMSTDQEFYTRGMAGAGLEYRFPLVAANALGTHTVEPIAQFIARPNEQHIGEAPNEDAQSLFFDDTTLFAWDKFSGWDRVEGGGRANIGLQYTWQMPAGTMINVLFGQSYHLFGLNSFARSDAAGTGLDSGLEGDTSDYVARFFVQASPNFALASRFRLSEDDFNAEATEIEGRFSRGRLTSSLMYARYDERPRLGFTDVREGILTSNRLNLTENVYLRAGALYDIERDEFSNTSFGLGYLDECFDLEVTYATDYSRDGNKERVHQMFVKLSLRTLGDANISTSIDTDSDSTF